MSLSTYAQQALLKELLGIAEFTKPVTLYLAAFTTNPTMPAGTGGVEVSGGGYARQAITFSATTSGSSAQGNNSALVQFPTATAAWGTVTGAGLYDAANGGNLLDAGPLAVNKTIGVGDVFAMPIGNYALTLT